MKPLPDSDLTGIIPNTSSMYRPKALRGLFEDSFDINESLAGLTKKFGKFC